MYKDLVYSIHSVVLLIYLGIQSCRILTLSLSQSKRHFVWLIERLDCVLEVRITILLSTRRNQTPRERHD